VATGGNDIRTVDGFTYHTFTATGSQDLIVTPTRTLSGVISGSGGFTFDSPGGTLVLTAANTYSGDTIISAGTLALGNGGSVAHSNIVLNGGDFNVSALAGGYTVESGTSLSGNGSVTGDLTISGTLTIGSSPGMIGFLGDLGLNGDADFEITSPTLTAGSYDLALGTGTVTFGGALNLFFSGGAYSDGATVRLFEFDGGYSGGFAAVNFSGLGPGQSASFDAATGFVTVIPEPATAMLGGIGFLLLLRRRR
jgi:autotransporter-associated beta strand protein